MSLSEEKMMILKMLQEGKISSEEAAKLLEALDGAQKQSTEDKTAGWQQKPQANYYDEVAKVKERINEWKKDFKNNFNQKDFDKMVDDFSVKAEKVGKNVATATFGIVDRVADFVGSVVDTGSFSFFGGYAVEERTFEADGQEGLDLDLEAANGQIVVKKHQEPNIVIKSRVRSSQNNADGILLFSNSGNAVSLKMAKIEGFPVSVSHEVYVPAVRFNKLKLESRNGKVTVEDTAAKEFEFITKNAGIDLMGVTGDKVTVDTKNGKISANYVIGQEISLNTRNGAIDVKNLKVGKLGAYTGNARISVENVQHYEGSEEATLELRTKNGQIKANMNDTDNSAYRVKAHTTNGGINLLIPGLLYRNNPGQGGSAKNAEAETEGFDEAPKKVTIYAETSNGYVEIVK